MTRGRQIAGLLPKGRTESQGSNAFKAKTSLLPSPRDKDAVEDILALALGTFLTLESENLGLNSSCVVLSKSLLALLGPGSRSLICKMRVGALTGL